MPAPCNDGDWTSENMEMLQTLQEMLVKISHIEVCKFTDKRAAVICCKGRENEDTTALESFDIL